MRNTFGLLFLFLSALCSYGQFRSSSPSIVVSPPAGETYVLLHSSSPSLTFNGSTTAFYPCKGSVNAFGGTLEIYGPKAIFSGCTTIEETWTGFSLPSYVNPSSITGVAAFAVSSLTISASSTGTLHELNCHEGNYSAQLSGSSLSADAPWSMKQTTAQLADPNIAANIANISCYANIANSIPLAQGFDSTLSVSDIGLIVYYTPVQGAPRETLHGDFLHPDGTGVNGSLLVELPGSTAKNICSTPYQVAPSVFKRYPVVNGVPVGLDQDTYLSSECLTPRHPYYMELRDSTNAPISSMNMYVPRLINASVDIGNAAIEQLATPIPVAVPVGIISTPSGSQTVTQPNGTVFTFNGDVVFNGNIYFGNSPTNGIIKATQVLVGGITNSTYPLDVLGYINASGGYLVNGGAGTSGECLVSNGTAFVPGTCYTPVAGTGGGGGSGTYYQTIFVDGTNQPQEPILSLASDSFAVADDPTNTATTVSLATTGVTSGVYTGINSITVDGYGRITNINSFGVGQSRTCNSNGCYRVNGDGTIEQWGHANGCSGVACNVHVTFPIAFVNTIQTLQVTESGGGANNFDAGSGNETNAGFDVQYSSHVQPGGSGGTLPGSQTAWWYAIGY